MLTQSNHTEPINISSTHVPKTQAPAENKKKEIFRMFVGGLSYKVDNKMLRTHFEHFGNIKKALIIRESSTGQSKGYGFVTFTCRKSYEEALNSSILITGVKADCHPVMTKRNLREKTSKDINLKIFVGGISQSTNKQTLEAYFGKYGPIEEIRILYDGNTGKSRGFAFVLFKERQSLEKALKYKSHKIKGKVVELKEFSSKNKHSEANKVCKKIQKSSTKMRTLNQKEEIVSQVQSKIKDNTSGTLSQTENTDESDQSINSSSSDSEKNSPQKENEHSHHPQQLNSKQSFAHQEAINGYYPYGGYNSQHGRYPLNGYHHCTHQMARYPPYPQNNYQVSYGYYPRPENQMNMYRYQYSPLNNKFYGRSYPNAQNNLTYE